MDLAGDSQGGVSGWYCQIPGACRRQEQPWIFQHRCTEAVAAFLWLRVAANASLQRGGDLCRATWAVLLPPGMGGQRWLLEPERALWLQHRLLVCPFSPSLPFLRGQSLVLQCLSADNGLSLLLVVAAELRGLRAVSSVCPGGSCSMCSYPELSIPILLWEPGQTQQWGASGSWYIQRDLLALFLVTSDGSSGTAALLETWRDPHPPWLQLWAALPQINNSLYLKSRWNGRSLNCASAGCLIPRPCISLICDRCLN